MDEVFSSCHDGSLLQICFLLTHFTKNGANKQLQVLSQSFLYSFREHPKFKKIAASRLEHDDIHGLAKSLSDLSVGRQP